MKTNVDSMEEEMTSLTDNMEAITSSSGRIDEHLSQRRKKIEKLVGVRKLLQKLQWLFDLPHTLLRCVEMEIYDRAVTMYTKSAPILKRHKHLASLSTIKDDCEKIIARLKEQLKNKLHKEEISSSKLAEYAALLLQLGEAAEPLRTSFLNSRRRGLLRVLSVILDTPVSAEEPEDERPKRSDETSDKGSSAATQREIRPGTALWYVTRLSETFIYELEEVIRAYTVLFPISVRENKQNLLEFAREVLNEYCNALKARLKESHLTFKTFTVALERMHGDLSRLHRALPESQMKDRAKEIIEHTVRTQLDKAMMKMRTGMIEHLRLLHARCTGPSDPETAPGSAAFNEFVTVTGHNILVDLSVGLTELQPLVEAQKTFLRDSSTVFVSLVLGHVADFFLTLNVAALSHFDDSKPKNMPELDKFSPLVPTGSYIISLVRNCSYMETRGVDKIVSVVHDLFVPNEEAQDAETFNHFQRIIAPDLIKNTRETSQKLLRYYTEINGLKVAQMIRKGVETANWLAMREPRDVRLAIELVIKEVAAVYQELTVIFGEPTRRSPTVDSAHYRRMKTAAAAGTRPAGGVTGTKRVMELNMNMDRLFAHKLQTFGPVAFSRGAVVAGIVKIMLKTFYECVRLRTFDRNGYQQMQVDTGFLSSMLRDYLEPDDLSILDGLIEEVLVSTSKRCLDPTPMDQSIVDNLCEAKRAKFAI
eukprot:GILJ01007001.1.p1 GENE.GILJ01007001.1~~GILJ01007001.1.p1  ORF type:complete len:822 (-),score=154.49 GILJ01007001.1:94-2208(-)